MMTSCERIQIDRDPFLPSIDHAAYGEHKEAAQWLWMPEHHLDDPGVILFRCELCLSELKTAIFHVSADNRYELFLDGERVGRGPSRGDRYHWSFETYKAQLSAGKHTFCARVWWFPEEGSPMAQMVVRPGFMLSAEGNMHESLSTGHGPWKCLPCNAFSQNPGTEGEYHVTGWAFVMDGESYPWGWMTGDADGWLDPVRVERAVGQARSPFAGDEAASRWGLHHLKADPLPAMLEVERQVGKVRYAGQALDGEGPVHESNHDRRLARDIQRVLDGKGAVRVAPHTAWRAVIDLEQYYCAYPQLTVSGGEGAAVEIAWAESLFHNSEGRSSEKGNRDGVWDKWFCGDADRFELEGGNRVYDTLWWRAGRYLLLSVATDDAPLNIDNLVIRETRYPLERESDFGTDDERLSAIEPIMMRALQMCSHETYMDCPYYEQLMYAGDTRLEILATYVSTFDTQLPRRAIELFDWSRAVDGLTKSRYPSRVLQVIPPFSLWWISTVHDYFMWRDADIRAWLPGVQTVLGAFEQYLNGEGLVRDPAGWNFCDWVPGWSGGVPPSGHGGVSCLLNLQFLYALDRGAAMLEYWQRPDQAAHWKKVAEKLRPVILQTFWNEERGLLADDLSMGSYSEHCQALALLCDLVDGEQRERLVDGLLSAELSRCTIYFSHYLFEAFAVLGAMDALWERLGTWFELVELGFKTTREAPEPSRSDCHAWGAHPLYHYYATMAGVRPAAPGFSEVRVEPHFGHLTHMRGKLPHPSGKFISFDLRRDGDDLASDIKLPDGVRGTLVWGDRLTDC